MTQTISPRLPVSARPAFLPVGLWWLVPILLVAFFSARPLAFAPGVCALLTLAVMLTLPASRNNIWAALQLLLRGVPYQALLTWLLALVGLQAAFLHMRISPQTQELETIVKFLPLFLGGTVLVAFAAILPVRQPVSLSWLSLLFAMFGLALLAELLLDFPVYRAMKDLSDTVEVNPSELNKRAALFFLTIPAVAQAIMLAQGRWRNGLAVIYTVPVICLFALTQSQAAQLAVPVMLLVWLGSHYWPTLMRRLVFGGFAVFVVVAPFLFPFAYQAVSAAFGAKNNAALEAASVLPRLELWAFISDNIQHRFWTGYGIDAASELSRLQWDWTYFRNIKIYHPHNAVLQFWLEMGVSGTALMLTGIYGLNRYISTQTMRAQRLALTSFSGCAVFALVTWSMWQSWWLGTLFFVAALTMLVARHAQADTAIAD